MEVLRDYCATGMGLLLDYYGSIPGVPVRSEGGGGVVVWPEFCPRPAEVQAIVTAAGAAGPALAV
jgi:hypothetical protein